MKPTRPNAQTATRPVVRSALRAWLLATTLSGAPSTAWSLLRGRDPLGPARAAGTLLPGRVERPSLPAGLVAHAAISAWWILPLAALARWRGIDWKSAAVSGLAIAALDLGIVGKRYPAIAELDQLPQWLDHVAFAVLAGRYLQDLCPIPDQDRSA